MNIGNVTHTVDVEPIDEQVPAAVEFSSTCDCESYDCAGECCGVGNCTCTTLVDTDA